MKLNKESSGKQYPPDRHGFRAQLDETQDGHEYGKGLEIYCDGSCRPHNPGPGRYGFVVVENNNKIHEWVGGKRSSNNAEMEVWALKAALMFVVEQALTEAVVIHTDSGYCCSGYNSWMHNWVKANWKGKKYPTEWKEMYSIWQEYPNVTVKWIAAHSGHRWNEYIDQLIGRKHSDKSLEIDRLVRGIKKAKEYNEKLPETPEITKEQQQIVEYVLQIGEAHSILQDIWNTWEGDDLSGVHSNMRRVKEYLDKYKQ